MARTLMPRVSTGKTELRGSCPNDAAALRRDHDKLKVDGWPLQSMLHRATRKPFDRETILVHQATTMVIPMSTFPRTMMLAAALSLAVAAASAQVPADRPAPPVMVAPAISLSLEQRDTIREFVKEVDVANAAPETPMAIGDTVPKEVPLHPMPARVGEKVSKVKNHLFFRKGTEFAIVDPKDNKIVDVIK
jgi:hypothetical protein